MPTQNIPTKLHAYILILNQTRAVQKLITKYCTSCSRCTQWHNPKLLITAKNNKAPVVAL